MIHMLMPHYVDCIVLYQTCLDGCEFSEIKKASFLKLISKSRAISNSLNERMRLKEAENEETLRKAAVRYSS